MEWPTVEKLLSVIGDTTVLLISFIAIGIPLAIQSAKQISDKYNSPFLAKRLINYYKINPTTLISVATIYISISFLIRTGAIEPTKPTLIATLFLFLIIISCTATFYINMYRRSVERNEDLIKNLLFKRGEITKTPEKFNAGLEVLLDGIKNKSWQQEYISILFEVIKKTKESGVNRKNIIQLKTTWLFLLRLSRLTRENQNSVLSFHSQRLLFSLVSKIVHGRQYYDIVESSSFTLNNDKIDWTKDIYELARWQSHQSSLGIDLALECEWISNILHILTEPDFIYSKSGTLEALRLYIAVLQIVAKNHPKKIINHYKNLSENIPSAYFPNLNKAKYSLQTFFYRFYSGEHSFHDEKTIEEKISDALAASKNIKTSISEKDLKEIENKINYQYLYKKALKKELRRTAAEYIATLAYYERFDELIECIDWKKPSTSTINYIGEVLFPYSIPALASQIFSCKRHEIESITFERHDPEVMLYRGYAAILTHFIKKGKPTAHDFFSNQSNFPEKKHSYNMLNGALIFLKSKKFFCTKSISATTKYIKKSFNEAQEQEKNRVYSSRLNAEKIETARNKISERWKEIIHREFSLTEKANKLHLFNILVVRYTKEVQPESLNLFQYVFDKNEFLDEHQKVSNIEIFSDAACDKFQESICYHLFKEAEKLDEKSELIDNETLLFADKNTLVRLGFERENENTLYWRSKVVVGAEAIQTRDINFRILKKNSYQLVLTKNVSTDGNCPLFITFQDNGEAKVKLNIGLYYSINKINQPKI